MKRRGLWIVAIVVIIITIFSFATVFVKHGSNESDQQAIVKLHGEITPGDTREQVLRHYYALRTDNLRMSCDRPAEWIISMPLEFGASDWSLRLEFDQDRVSAVRMRTSDGPKPNASPDDKAKPDKGIQFAK